LYMLHGVGNDKELRKQTWKILENYYREGKIKALGVSNYDQYFFSELYEFAKQRPVVLSHKFDVYHHACQLRYYYEDLLTYCHEQGIIMEAYAPLSGWPFALKSAEDPHIIAIAKQYNRTPQQIILRWLIQMGVAVIPRSANEKHIRENSELFDFLLTDEDARYISALVWFVASPVHNPFTQNVFDIKQTWSAQD